MIREYSDDTLIFEVTKSLRNEELKEMIGFSVLPRMVIGSFYRQSAPGGLLRQEVMLVLILRLLLVRLNCSLVTAMFGRTRG